MKNTKRLIGILALAMTITTIHALTLSWDPNPVDEQVTGYTVYQSTNAAGPYSAVATVTNTSWYAPLPPGQYFFYVTASNFWSESPPSKIVNTPQPGSKVANPKAAK